MEILNKKQKTILIIIVGIILLFIVYYIINKANNSKYINLETEMTEETDKYSDNNIEDIKDYDETNEENSTEIVIHVTGAVKKQGIVKVKNGDRISDVIDAAGGITKKADLSKINLAYLVEDGQKIYVPSIDDKDTVVTVKDNAGDNVIESENSSSSGKVNINTATQTEFETLNGIGTSTALKIINYRDANGKFKKIEDIKNVPGIGDAKFENIKEYISVK